MLRFESPWMFLLLLLIPLAFYRGKSGGRPAVRFSAVGDLKAAGTSLRQALLPTATVFRVLALILIVIALARPQSGTEKIRDLSRGIAIEMVVDRSSSMGAEMRYEGRNHTRLEVVKRVFQDFIDGTGDLPGRPNDLIGMITFARYPDTICPLTLDHSTLDQLIDNVRLVNHRPEDGTAIGDAVALAAARLTTAEETLARQTGASETRYEIKSKIIILLTDGENNAGNRSVDDAAKLAREWGIKVYAIGVGEDRGLRTPFGVVNLPKDPQVHDQALLSMAESTGGVYRLATDADSLVEIYSEIDELERSEIESVRYLDYRELFAPFALMGLLLVGVELVLRATLLRTIP